MLVEELIGLLEEYKDKDFVVCLPGLNDIAEIEIDEESGVIHLVAEY